MKRRAVFGQWKTPPHVLYPSGSSAGMKKSTSMPVFSTHPANIRNGNGVPQNAPGYTHEQQRQESVKPSQQVSKAQRQQGSMQDGGIRRAVSYSQVSPMDAWHNSQNELKPASSGTSTGKRNAEGVRRVYSGTTASLNGVSDGDELDNRDGSGGGSGGDNERSEHEKRNKRLARNRASARMRRLRKKTVVETLERECEHLESSIALLRSMEQSRQSRSAAEQEGMFIGFRLPAQLEEQRNLLMHVFGGEEEAHSISMTRRRAAMQLFLDRQIFMSRSIQKQASLNNLICNLSLSDDPVVSSSNVSTRLRAQRLSHESCTRAMSYRLASHLPVTEQEFAERPRKPVAGAGTSLASAVYKVPDPETGTHQDVTLVSVNGQPPNPPRVATGISALDLSQNPRPSDWTEERIANETESLQAELRATLDLDPAQVEKLKGIAPGLRREQVRVDCMVKAALSIATHDWFEFPCTEATMSQFRGVLTAQQMVKFLGWSDRNLMAIKALPIVSEKHVPEQQGYPPNPGKPLAGIPPPVQHKGTKSIRAHAVGLTGAPQHIPLVNGRNADTTMSQPEDKRMDTATTSTF